MKKTNVSKKQSVGEKNPVNKPQWDKPKLQQLRVSLDTAFGLGSGTDGATGTGMTP